jgi:hypothetical protein
MSKYCSENERVKRDYSFYLEAANGKQSGTIDAALRAIERFEDSTNRKPFRKFNVEQARSFRARLGEETGASGKPLSVATIASTLKHLRNFFLWLSREPGFRAARGPGLCRRRLVSGTMERRGAHTADIPSGLRGGRASLRQAPQLPRHARAARRAPLPHARGMEGLEPKPRP